MPAAGCIAPRPVRVGFCGLPNPSPVTRRPTPCFRKSARASAETSFPSTGGPAVSSRTHWPSALPRQARAQRLGDPAPKRCAKNKDYGSFVSVSNTRAEGETGTTLSGCPIRRSGEHRDGLCGRAEHRILRPPQAVFPCNPYGQEPARTQDKNARTNREGKRSNGGKLPASSK